MPTIHQHAAAARDLVDHFVYLAENASLDTAERSLTRAEASFDELALQPLMGAPLALERPELAGLRKWRVKDFDNHLIFYLPEPDAIAIVRVLHAASDWWGLLGIDSVATTSARRS
jgi:toxin ParE1/3/4